jgi:hypothetical protein
MVGVSVGKSWQLAVGSWQLAVGSWQLAVGRILKFLIFFIRVIRVIRG